MSHGDAPSQFEVRGGSVLEWLGIYLYKLRGSEAL